MKVGDIGDFGGQSESLDAGLASGLGLGWAGKRLAG